jgi:hypothetical protein
MFMPTDLANLALDKVGFTTVLGDLEDGTKAAQVCLRAYRECLQQLLRGAHWQFARKQAPLTLLGDASGQTPNVGTVVIRPWRYEYAYPTDCCRLIYVPFRHPPAQGMNYALPNIPINPALAAGNQNQHGGRPRPSRFLVARDNNYPATQGQITWEVQGVSPQGRTVILSDVPQAQAVYTSLTLYPSEWDALFRGAFVAFLASEIAVPLADPTPQAKQMAMKEREAQIAIVKMKLTEARIADGNETTSSTAHVPDWLQFRRTGGGFFGRYGGNRGGEDGEGGGDYNNWAPVYFSNGSAY